MRTLPAEFTDDRFGVRSPTSHERMTGEPWNESYRDGPAPWDIGGPQSADVRLAAAGAFADPVLDAECFSGTGEDMGPHPVNRDRFRAVFDAASGWNVVGVAPVTEFCVA